MAEEFDWRDVPDGLIPFPDAETVFGGDVQAHRKVLLPLISIPAEWVDETLSGLLHFVTPIEPYDGLLGEETQEFHSGYCKTNWIAFRVTESKYEFLGDFRYFKINKGFEGQHAEANAKFLADRYSEIEADFAETKANYKATGKLQRRNRIAGVWMNAVGGAAPAANWTAFSETLELEDGDLGQVAHPLTTDGRRFRFVGEVSASSFRKDGADGVLLFYDPESRTALLTFEWT